MGPALKTVTRKDYVEAHIVQPVVCSTPLSENFIQLSPFV